MFQLPPDISYNQEQLPDGFAFNFRHARLGDLGRILLQDHPDGQTQILCEVIGDPNDPMTGELQMAMKDEWYRRGHPRWRGSKFANCAYRCAKNCRNAAEPLDDACYAPCFARCEAAVAD